MRNILAVALAMLAVGCAGEDVTPEELGQVTSKATQWAGSSINGRPVNVWFNDPAAHGGSDTTINDVIRDLINSVTPGQQIRLTLFSELTHQGVADALTAAANRNVYIWVLYNGGYNCAATTQASQVCALHNQGRANFQARFCNRNGSSSCQGGNIMHAKTMLISGLTDIYGGVYNSVSFMGTNNWNCGSGSCKVNSAVAVYNDANLYNGLVGWFGDAWAQVQNPRKILGDVGQAFTSPQTASDPILDELNLIQPDAGCVIRVMHMDFTSPRQAIANRLKTLRSGGCNVKIILGQSPTADLSGLTYKVAPNIHDKNIVWRGKATYSGGAYVHRVMLGSHNLQGPALTNNDETLIHLRDNGTLYNGFISHWNEINAQSAPVL
jgi:phosphatidylserine/phosphatidylglycerophosphate/cardiolipin synthase-like enzyme